MQVGRFIGKSVVRLVGRFISHCVDKLVDW